ncbi:hypothetical protein, partial [Coleofasciculus sp.]|uniref:hypothetical protein n=1 Tax=Coleofasciculus sp. TaxID=3100458 RepID=UPI003A3BE498
EREAELERERKDREAAEQRNLALAEANRKAKRRISIGGVVLIVAVLGAVISGVLAGNKVIEANSKVSRVGKIYKPQMLRLLFATFAHLTVFGVMW